MQKDESLKDIISEANIIMDECRYSEHRHYKSARNWRGIKWSLGIPVAILSAVAGTTALADFSHNEVVAGIIAMAVTVFTALNSFLNASENSESHFKSEKGFKELADNIRMFSNVEISNKTLQDRDTLRDELDNFLEKKTELVKNGRPIPPPKTKMVFSQSK